MCSFDTMCFKLREGAMRSKGFLVFLAVILIFIQIPSLCFAENGNAADENTSGIPAVTDGTDTDEVSDGNTDDAGDSNETGSTADGAGSGETGSTGDDSDTSETGNTGDGSDAGEAGNTGDGADTGEAGDTGDGLDTNETGSTGDGSDTSETGNTGDEADTGEDVSTGDGTDADETGDTNDAVEGADSEISNTGDDKVSGEAGNTRGSKSTGKSDSTNDDKSTDESGNKINIKGITEPGNMNSDVYGTTLDSIGVGAATMVPVPEISAPSAILVEAETGQTLYYKNIDIPLHISAANKLMTVLVAVENGQLSSFVTVSSDSVDTEGSVLNLKVGQKYLLSDLLYAVMLTSANDAAVAVAEHISSGDISKFVELMNKTAQKLEMTNTRFTNPTGLYSEGQYTTARDISKLVRYAVKNAQFNAIFTAKADAWDYAGSESRFLTSSNRLFWEYDGIRGGKTGYNNKDQQTVICTAARSNLQLISIVLDAPENTMFTDTTALFDYGFNNFRKSTLVSKNEIIKKVTYEENEVRLISQNDIMYVHPIGESYIKDFEATADLKPPLKRTVPAGNAVYILGDGTKVSISLYPDSEIVPVEDVKARIQKRIIENKDIFLIVAVLLAIEALLLLYNIGKLFSKLVSLIMRRKRRS
jgi:D-alanyl-D-alanine carboxypeptidase (penicillin-binding protein 5/6)